MNHNGLSLGPIVVDKGWLIDQLVTNRDAHHAAYLTAVDEFRRRAIEHLESLVSQLRDGKIIQLLVPLPVPVEHLDDYNRALGMLHAHTSLTIELSEAAYATLVQDEWGWRSMFLASTMSYVNTSLGGARRGCE